MVERIKPEELYARIERRIARVDQSIGEDIGHDVEMLYTMLQSSRDEARTDPLTGLANYRGLSETLERELAKAKRHSTPLVLGFIDFDRLKFYNDTYGHEQANHAIKTVAASMRDALRDEDILARYGGDEFCLVLTDTELERAKNVLERVQENVKSLSIDAIVDGLPNDDYKVVTVSIGYTAIKDGESPTEIIDRADKAMKIAKDHRGSGKIHLLEDIRTDPSITNPSG